MLYFISISILAVGFAGIFISKKIMTLEERIVYLEDQVRNALAKYPRSLIDDVVDEIVNTAKLEIIGITAAQLKSKSGFDNCGSDLSDDAQRD